MSSTNVELKLPIDQATALAQMAKRFGRDHAVSLSNPHALYGEERECDVMLEAVMALGRALAEAGFKPR